MTEMPEALEEPEFDLSALAAQVERNRVRVDAVASSASRFGRIIAFLTAFTILAFSVVSWRTEVQQNDINNGVRQDRARAYAQCLVANGNATHLNEFLDQIIASVRASSQLTPQQREVRIKAYSAIKQQLPACEKPDSSDG